MTHDVDLELVRDLHPPADEPMVSAAAKGRERARVALMAEIERADIPQRRGWTFDRPRLRGRRLGPLGALGIAASLGVAVALALLLRGGAANPTSAAAAVLQRAAHAAAASGGPRQLRPGEYWYVKSYDTSAGALVAARPSVRGGLRVIVDALQTTERQVWLGVDRPGLIVTRVTRPITFLSVAAREQWIRYGRPRQITPTGRTLLPADSFIRPYRQLQALPSKVDALWRVIERGAGKGSPAWKRHEMFIEIGDLLREDPIPAKVRAALYLVAARIPGIRMLGVTHDGIGRPALAVALNDSLYGMREELLLDPHTSALLGESQVVVKPPASYHVAPGTVRTGSTYITSGIVERIGQVPGH
jgi:hypothetical protein